MATSIHCHAGRQHQFVAWKPLLLLNLTSPTPSAPSHAMLIPREQSMQVDVMGARTAPYGSGPATAKDHHSPLHGHRDVVWSVDFSPDGRQLASSGQDGDGVRTWQAATGREVVTMRGHDASVEQFRFTPDGRLATAHDDSIVRIWQCEVCGPITEVRSKAGALATRALTAEERDAFVLPTL